MRLAVPLLAALAGAALGACTAGQGQPGVTDHQIVGHVYEPQELEPTDERVASLRVPPGFKVAKFAEGLKNPRILAVVDDGTVYATRHDVGDVVMLRDSDDDHVADIQLTVAARPDLHGIAVQGRRV